MAIVSNKCPSCGSNMKFVNNQFECEACGTMLFHIAEAKIDADVTVMSPEEFERVLEASKSQMVVNINDKFQVLDVDTLVINKKIKDATIALNVGSFDKVHSHLQGVPDNILSATRLRYLSGYKVRNEVELSRYRGYVDDTRVFNNLISLCDEPTAETYKKIAKLCRENHDLAQTMKKEISEVDRLLEVKLFDEAITYATGMCKKYPQTARSWVYLFKAKKAKDNSYNGDNELAIMQKCSDFYCIEEAAASKNENHEFHDCCDIYVTTQNNIKEYKKIVNTYKERLNKRIIADVCSSFLMLLVVLLSSPSGVAGEISPVLVAMIGYVVVMSFNIWVKDRDGAVQRVIGVVLGLIFWPIGLIVLGCSGGEFRTKYPMTQTKKEYEELYKKVPLEVKNSTNATAKIKAVKISGIIFAVFWFIVLLVFGLYANVIFS